MTGGPGHGRKLLAAGLLAALLAGCGGGSKHTTSTPTATGPAVSKASYQATAVGVLRPMLHAIDDALRTPRQAAVWQEVQRSAQHAYTTIGAVRPPANVADLDHRLVKDLGNVSSTAGSLFHDLSANDLSSAQSLGTHLVSEGQDITGLGNQFKSRGYQAVGAILAGP